MLKIAVMGVHGAGKTSLTYILSAYFKMKGINVKLIHESVRENCPFPINADANQGTCLWNFHTQFRNELDAEAQGYQLAICDRSVLDTFVYFHAVNPENNITRSALGQASQWLPTYDILICVSPSEDIDLVDDGIRATDKDYRDLIKCDFEKALKEYGSEVLDRVMYISSRDIFELHNREVLINNIEKALEHKLEVVMN